MEITRRGLELWDTLEESPDPSNLRRVILEMVINRIEVGQVLRSEEVIKSVHILTQVSTSKINSTMDRLVSQGYLQESDQPYYPLRKDRGPRGLQRDPSY